MKPLMGILLSCAFAAPGLAQGARCADDAMLVFDASGSMASAGYNELSIPRIQDALDAMRKALPQVEAFRNLGLLVYGPGTRDACANIDLKFAPAPLAARRILSALEALAPNGDTPLTEAVARAAEALDFKTKPAVVVLVTDGEETCGGAPCAKAQALAAEGKALTVHVIGFKLQDAFFQWKSQDRPAEERSSPSRCLAELTGGMFIPANTTDDLVAALLRTLGCSLLTEAGAVRRAPRG
jgi:Ca-activated chloride channel homolog